MEKKFANRQIIIALIGAAVLALCLLFLFQGLNPLGAKDGIQYEVVSSEAAQEKGLGGRTEVAANYGMLFVFPEDDRYGFWMKDMLVPIDIIWLSDNGTIVGIEDSVAPSTYPSVFYPPQPVRYVLEMRAGSARARGWNTGSSINIPLRN